MILLSWGMYSFARFAARRGPMNGIFASLPVTKERLVLSVKYSPFRGKDGDQKLEEHLNRLPLEIDIELERMKDFANHHIKDNELAEKALKTYHERRDWDDKFTVEERTIIDKIGGSETFEEVAQIINGGVGSDWETFSAQFALLEQFKPLLDIADDVRVPKERIQEVTRMWIDKRKNSLPSVSPKVGFPSNEETLEKQNRWIESLNKSCHLSSFPNPIGTLKSPFGPVSSSSCYEELSEFRSIHLNQLRETGTGTIPDTKMLVTVRHKAVVSPSRVVTTVVEDREGQLILMQMHNMKGVSLNATGLKSLPIGARFFLKNPFLKVANDGWLILRVDQPFDLERLDLPPLSGSILVVGDGDFSFSAALARKNQEGGGSAFIVTSSLDSKDDVIKKYKKGRHNLNVLDDDNNVDVVHCLDASDLSPLGEAKWDSIVWNFPYPATRRGSIQPGESQELLSGFLNGMGRYLKVEGKLYLTLAKRQGGTTREAAATTLGWDVETAASDAGMEVVEVLPFSEVDYPGYEPRRAYADETFPYKEAKVHILRLQVKADVGEVPSQRTRFSRLSSIMLDWLRGPPQGVIVRSEATKQLERYENESQTARSLLVASRAFDEVMKLIREKGNQDTISYEQHVQVTKLLAQVFLTKNGDLVTLFSREELKMAIISARTVLASFFNDSTPWQDLVVEIKDYDSPQFVRSLQSRYSRVDEAQIALQHDVSFEDGIVVLANLEVARGNISGSIDILSVALAMVPETKQLAPLPFLRGSMKANLLVQEDPQGQCTAQGRWEDVLRDFEHALQAFHDKSEPLYLSTLYSTARIHLDLSIATQKSVPEKRKHAHLAIVMYQEYIAMAEPDDRMVAPAHYRIGWIFASEGGRHADYDDARAMEIARSHYIQGLAAEKERLPFFGPSTCPFKKPLSIITMEKMIKPSCKTKSTSNVNEKTFIEDVKQLLEKRPQGIYLGQFKDAYSREFGRPVPSFDSDESLRKLLERVEKGGGCRLEMRGRTELWVCPTDTPSSKREPPPTFWGEKEFFDDVKQLLKKFPGGIYLGRFRDTYSQEYGRPVPQLSSTKSLRKSLERAEAAGFCRVEKVGKSEFWVRTVDTPLSRRSSENEFHKELKQLLDEHPKGICLAQFKQEYKKRFGKTVPFLDTKSLHNLLSEATAAGVGKLVTRNKSGLWIMSSASHAKSSTKASHKDTSKAKQNENDFFAKVKHLLEDHPEGIYLGIFKRLYQEKFVKKVPHHDAKSLKDFLGRAKAAGACGLEKRGETEYWVVPVVSPK